ncbi:MAG: hypothetical protein ACE144_10055 [Thermodesulfobacteriota bacterium]
MATQEAQNLYPYSDTLRALRVFQAHRLSERASRGEIEEGLFDDSRAGQGLGLIAVLGTIFWTIILWLVS